MFETAFRIFREILFPKRCPFCGALIPPASQSCETCAPILPFLPEGVYKRRGIPVYVPFSYSGVAEQAVWRLKFYGKPAVARHLAPYLAAALPPEMGYDVIVPIPMDRRKQKKRGYNQAALLAKFLGENTGIPMLECMEKTRRTAEQHTLNARERETNLTGAYRLPQPDVVRGKRVLLCDDVITTGSTIQEAARLLTQAGAVSVDATAITLAGEQEGETHALIGTHLPHIAPGNPEPHAETGAAAAGG